MRPARLLALALIAATPAHAEPPVTVTVTGSYDDVQFDIENAITDAGLVIDSVNHVGDMLERTKADVGGSVTIFTHAETYNFCSAEISRQVMEADPLNLQHCPYRIFLMERPDAPGEVVVGHPRYPEGPMDAVNALLDGIIADALAGY
ncbi:DUF302 domain-containing protein [Sinisalibacter aestuarii]|uniref:DUF302 domain-containing protein n=1 Tax=Sinisalibacter aestuarii TaxID=2949426 RepID=A0ABQ5LZ35_9RHOB|nr:DUF302 domain-containing protein [Sinisalibacter aestuarii]GKY90233.1 hypothetical protein STA1M1_41020 [Sinisalibacter aestuarii]